MRATTRPKLRELNEVFDLRVALEKADCQLQNLRKASGDSNLFEDEIALVEERADQLRKNLTVKEKEVERFVSSINDARLALAFRLRFIRGMLWKEISFLMGVPEEAICRMCCRYLDQFQTDEKDGVND